MISEFSIHDLNPHDKPRERLLNLGAYALSDSELLAIILRSGGSSTSVLALSSTILKRFGGFKGLLCADVKQLLSFKDIGTAKATSIKAMCEISLRMQLETTLERYEIKHPEDVFKLIKKDIYSKKKEHLFLIALDTKNRVISKDLISIGTITETILHPREVFTQALLKHALSIILVHNHPLGDPTPSDQDIELTRRIAKVGVSLGIPLIDHVVVSDTLFVSMKSENILEE